MSNSQFSSSLALWWNIKYIGIRYSHGYIIVAASVRDKELVKKQYRSLHSAMVIGCWILRQIGVDVRNTILYCPRASVVTCCYIIK